MRDTTREQTVRFRFSAGGRLGCLVGLLGAALLVTGCGASKPASPASLATRCGQPPLVQRPTVFSFSCDGNVVSSGARWTNWGESTAMAMATLSLAGVCVPDCASAPRYQYQARVVASEVALCGSPASTACSRPTWASPTSAGTGCSGAARRLRVDRSARPPKAEGATERRGDPVEKPTSTATRSPSSRRPPRRRPQ